MVVTSPPYWGLRDYQVAGQLGLEATPAEYVAAMVDVFGAVRRVLRDDGTLWLNLGDSYASKWPCRRPERSEVGIGSLENGKREARPERMGPGLKDKDLVGIPWRVAFALQADGWYLRSDIIWAKPNPMPESVTDRPTKSHEYMFLLAKSERYYYDAAAIAENAVGADRVRDDVIGGNKHNGGTTKHSDGGRFTQNIKPDKQRGHSRRHAGFNARWDAMTKAEQCAGLRNKRDVWTIHTEAYAGAHFATFPRALVEPCVKAGSRPGDTVLDPFVGSGTVLAVATDHGRHAIGCELNPAYIALSRARMATHNPLLTTESVTP